MDFSGLQKTSLIDFPNNIATVLFTPGCNLRCPFCYNWRIVLNPKGPYLSEKDVLRILESRKTFVNAVVITGGEPTMHSKLPTFLQELEERGYAIKIDTNGFFPEVLDQCLPHIDYVSMDVKTSPEKYRLLGAKDLKNLLRSIDILREGRTDYEFRTTVVPGFVDEDCIRRIGKIVKDAKRFVLQQFVPGDTLDKKYNEIKPYSKNKIAHLAEIMDSYVDKTILRV